MKVLFNCHIPFSLAHGGAQIQIEETFTALKSLGIQIDHMRWWEDRQEADILHHFGYVPSGLISLAQRQGIKVVNTALFTETVNRSRSALLCRQFALRGVQAVPLPETLKGLLPWRTFHQVDLMVVGLEAERVLLEKQYGVARSRIQVVPLGLSDTYLKAGPALRTENHLICTGRIHPSKNSLELAQLARQVQVPILFVGKPMDTTAPYWLEFSKLIDGRFVKHHPHVDSATGIVDLLRRAQGYVLMSRYENWCLAAHEAAACGLPLLLPDQRWARERFGGGAHFFPNRGAAACAAALRRFYDQCSSLGAPDTRLYSWSEAAQMLVGAYERLLS